MSPSFWAAGNFRKDLWLKPSGRVHDPARLITKQRTTVGKAVAHSTMAKWSTFSDHHAITNPRTAGFGAYEPAPLQHPHAIAQNPERASQKALTLPKAAIRLHSVLHIRRSIVSHVPTRAGIPKRAVVWARAGNIRTIIVQPLHRYVGAPVPVVTSPTRRRAEAGLKSTRYAIFGKGKGV